MTLAAKARTAPAPAPLSESRTVEFVADAIVDLANLADLADARGSRIAVVTVPAPVAPVAALLDAEPARGASAALWAAPGEAGLAGIGVAAELVSPGGTGDRTAGGCPASGHIRSIAGRARALWRRVVPIAYPGHAGPGGDADVPAPRMIGGFAFAGGAADRPPWQGFGDAWFALPRWTYHRGTGGALLSLAVDVAEAARRGAAWRDELVSVYRTLERGEELSRQPPRARSTGVPGGEPAGMASPMAAMAIDDGDPAPWLANVRAIRDAIRAGRFAKIVAARHSVADLGASPDPRAVLARLAARYPDCYRFAFIRGDAAFVGASPERLIERRGARVRTQALAGSIATSCAAPGDDAGARSGAAARAARALLGSGKDRGEQDLVVRAIADALAPLCAELSMPDEPEIRALRHVLHLETPITGRLARPVHVLDLVATLHPTPAVGGVPAADAVDWITAHEPPRGWYAAPVGWFDAAGDGEIAVAIRSGLLRGARAYVYAGAGIVADSDPEAELAETRLKQRAVMDALGDLP